MDAAQLQAFVTVVDLGSFTRAAARLCVSQPSVTTRIQALETEVGAKLLNRLYRSVSPTPAGLELLPLARDILRLTRLARSVAADDPAALRGRIALGSVESLMTFRLPPVIEHVYLNYPALEVDVHRVRAEAYVAELREGRLDCALLVGVPAAVPGLEVQVLCPEPLSVLASPRHPLAAADRLTRDDLLAATWVRSDDPKGYHARFMDTLEPPEGPPPRTFALASLDAVKRVVRNGVGLAIVPRVAAHEELADRSLVELPWRPPFDTFTQIAWRRDGPRNGNLRKLIGDVIRILDVGRDAAGAELQGALH